MFVALISSILGEKRFTKFVSEEIATAGAVTNEGGIGSRCPPARAIVRAVTATKHEPGLSPLYRAVWYGSAMEAWPS